MTSSSAKTRGAQGWLPCRSQRGWLAFVLGFCNLLSSLSSVVAETSFEKPFGLSKARHSFFRSLAAQEWSFSWWFPGWSKGPHRRRTSRFSCSETRRSFEPWNSDWPSSSSGAPSYIASRWYYWLVWEDRECRTRRRNSWKPCRSWTRYSWGEFESWLEPGYASLSSAAPISKMLWLSTSMCAGARCRTLLCKAS